MRSRKVNETKTLLRDQVVPGRLQTLEKKQEEVYREERLREAGMQEKKSKVGAEKEHTEIVG